MTYCSAFFTTTILAVAPLCLLSAPLTAQPLEALIDLNWAQNALWDDGQAELAHYQGTRVIYGQARPHDQTLITVKEDFNRAFYVKADWPYGEKSVFPVLKQNQVATIPTPNYPYHYMASVFFDRAKLEQGALKVTVSSQEWCGITTKEFALYSKVPTLTYMSYWDGQGTGSKPLDVPRSGVFFEEELPLLVRTLKFSEGATASFMLMENQTTSNVQLEPKATDAVLTVNKPAEALSLPLGQIPAEEYWTITIKTAEKPMTFQVANNYPNTLFAYDLGDKRQYTLKEQERRDYWVIRE